MYNNLIPTAWTDNANSIAMMLYGLQVVDVFSDVNLAIEMFGEFEGSQETQMLGYYMLQLDV